MEESGIMCKDIWEKGDVIFMFHILIVDDDNYKSKNILNLIANVSDQIDVSIEKAINPGLKRVRVEEFDIIILDMSLPLFDTTESSNFNPFGGISFLKEMKRRRIGLPVVIVTQYEIFGEGNSQKTSDALDLQCREEFENYIGIIVYSSSKNEWKEKLVRVLGEI